MKRFDTFGAYMFDLLFAPLKRGKRAANQFFIFFKVIGRIFDGMKKDAFRLRDELNVATASPGHASGTRTGSGTCRGLRARALKTIGPAYP